VFYRDTLFKDGDRDKKDWETLGHVQLVEQLLQFAAGEEQKSHTIDPAVAAWTEIFDEWSQGDAAGFNAAVKRYSASLTAEPPQGYSAGKVDFEAYFNHAAPFYYLMIPYVVAALLAASSWLGWSRTLNRTAFWLVVMTFALHTLALAGRIYISGRPPVTNLYSSAIFIGWAAVAFGIALERVYRLGFGNVMAGVIGFATLLIAHNLSGDGSDTFSVLQAVLDTQFWLATHVVTVTLGYAATYVAGFLALLYVILGLTTRKLGDRTGQGPKDQSVGQALIRMVYGVLCFALLFSFFGTVLGGLWADDSWGRFWGWDPKENGALIIVLWNALVLHARWAGIVKDRGLALLAVAGNVAVSWSWFGTNELGVGLHSYGFTDGVLLALGLFVLSQLVVVAAGLLPKSMWLSFRDTPSAA
jgi:ABC-type transport system involved in cytochrome c biogenesis permease subunit